VAGAAVGKALADGLGVADTVTVCVTVGAAAGATGDEAALLAGALALALACADPPAVPPGETLGVGEPDLAGENEVGTEEGVDPPQAETAPETSMAMLLQPMTANLALERCPAMVVRAFMKPPRACGGRRPRFPVPASETAPESEPRPGRCCAQPKATAPDTATKVRPPMMAQARDG
jgi:hypothetical protein